MGTLKTGSAALIDGVGQLKDGSKELKDGMNKFNDEGISKLTGALDEELPNITERFKAVRDASKGYTTFSGKSQDMDGTVKFIYMFDGTD